MSYTSGIDQRFLNQTFFNNTIAIDQPITATNLSLVANLNYVKNWVSSKIINYLPIANPNFTGTLTSTSGGNISLTNSASRLSVPTINGNTNFTGTPTIQINNTKYNIAVNAIGQIKMFINNASPANALKCDGSLYSTSTYPALFAVIGYTYGGSASNFAVPNMQSAFPIGANSHNSNNCAVSNFATGNGAPTANNTYSPSSNFAGASSASPALLTVVPPHAHNIMDPTHAHQTGGEPVANDVLPVPPLSTISIAVSLGVQTSFELTNITVLNTGTNIQEIDPISGLQGVNITPPFVAVFYYIICD